MKAALLHSKRLPQVVAPIFLLLASCARTPPNYSGQWQGQMRTMARGGVRQKQVEVVFQQSGAELSGTLDHIWQIQGQVARDGSVAFTAHFEIGVPSTTNSLDFKGSPGPTGEPYDIKSPPLALQGKGTYHMSMAYGSDETGDLELDLTKMKN